MIHLQCPLLDEHHTEFYTLLDSFNPNAFEASFMRLLEHTRTHFAHEESLMKEHRFQGYFEHHEEHVKILSEMEYFLTLAQNGRYVFAKNYIAHGIQERFENHIRNIDSQLALFLKNLF